MDLDPVRWVRDFVVLGGGIGGLAPLVVLIPMSLGNGAQWFPLALDATIAVAGALLGVVVGGVLWGVAWLFEGRPLWLTPIGFPVGGLAGLLVGATAGSFLHSQAILVVGGLGMVTGGMVLGLTWLPYLALKAAGRSGLPVVLGGVLGSPLAGALAMFTLYWSGI